MCGLILKTYLKTTYRGVIDYLENSPPLQQALGLERLPHYTTLKKFADRSGVAEVAEWMMAEILKEVGVTSDTVAVDSTGLETTSASAHYQTRRGGRRQQYVKVSLAILCTQLLPAGLVVDWGPRNDKAEAAELLHRTRRYVRPKYLLADAGYDAEWVHQFCRETWGVRSYIPPAVHRDDGNVGGRYRSQMTQLPRRYGMRWHVESFFSGLKRTMGSTLNARQDQTLFAEAALKVLTYALRR
ncbi:MAG: hypothetical protein HJJLKODD_00141 [Phycisphaerae bacterium]|nr:hypothetical protein [Phycisphaerae bacterium]